MTLTDIPWDAVHQPEFKADRAYDDAGPGHRGGRGVFPDEGEERLGVQKKVMDDISSCRVIFGEADFLPGIVVDKFFRCACGGIPGSWGSTGLKRRLSVS